MAIVGTGQMGTLLATRIPGSYRKVIISDRKAQAVALADEVGGIASDQLSAVRGCRVVFLAVPGTDLARVIPEMQPHLLEGGLVINMAEDVETDDLEASYPHVRFAAAKVIGHAREMSLGSPGVVVLDHVTDVDEPWLREILGEMGSVIRGQEEMVRAAHASVVEVMTRAEEELRNRLTALGLDAQLVQTAITTTGPGVLRTISERRAQPRLNFPV